MSTFSGKIEEIPNISVDRFDKENLKSEAFFLSHCHTDHMVGLCSYFFKSELVDKKKYLYASEISCTILKKIYPDFRDNIRILPLNTPNIFQLKNSYFSVTLIPAGHCPGSVMFLFENGKNILYTGDYRVKKSDIKKFTPFYDTYGTVKIIDTIYLDTTFFSKKYPSFPTREESLQQLCDILKKWLEEDADNFIHIKTSARYGYEYVYKEIFKKIGMAVHVNEDIFKFYSLVPELDATVTLNANETRIHGNCGTTLKLNCLSNEKLIEIKTVKLSAMMWVQDRKYEPEVGTHYICYSTHASYEEGAALINFLKPKDIKICVEHENDSSINNEIRKLIKHHLHKAPNVSKNNQLVAPKLFNTAKRKESLENTQTRSVDSNFEQCLQQLDVKQEEEILIDMTDVNVVTDVESINVPEKEDFLKEKVSDTVQNDSDDDKSVLHNILFNSPESSASKTINKVIDIIPDVETLNVPKKEDCLKGKLPDTVQNDSDDDKRVLHNLLFNSPEGIANKTINKVVDVIADDSDEEDSVIYNIVEWSPSNKRKKL